MEIFKRLRDRVFPLGYKNDFKVIFTMAIPIMLTNLSQMFMPILSVVFCGHLGDNELEGIGLANSLIALFVLTFIYGMATACDTMFPQVFGGTDMKKMGIILQKALMMNFAIALGCSAILLNIKYFLQHVVESPEVVVVCDQFLRAYIPAILCQAITTILGKYLQSQNIIYPVMVMNFIGIIMDAVLQALFVYVLEMGVTGSAIAVDIATFITVILLIGYIYFTKIYKATWPGLSRECLYDWSMYLKLGVPGVLTFVIEWSNFEIGTVAAASIDKTELALIAIVMQVLSVVYQAPFSIAISSNIYVGQLLGSGCPQNAKNASRVSYTICWMAALITSSAVFFGASVIPMVFTSSKIIHTKAVRMLHLTAFIHLLDSTQGNGAGIMRSVGCQLYSSVIYFIGFYCISLPISLSLLFLTPLRAFGFLIGVFVGLIALIILQIIYILRIDWKKKSMDAVKLTAPVIELDEKQMAVDETSHLLQKTSSTSSFRVQLVKRLLAGSFLLALFVVSVILRSFEIINDLGEQDLNSTNATTLQDLNFTSTDVPAYFSSKLF